MTEISQSPKIQNAISLHAISLHAIPDVADHSILLQQQNLDILAEHVEESKRMVVALSEPGKQWQKKTTATDQKRATKGGRHMGARAHICPEEDLPLEHECTEPSKSLSHKNRP